MTILAGRALRLLPVPAVLALALLAGCGGGTATPGTGAGAPSEPASASASASASVAAVEAPEERTVGAVTVTATSVIVGDPEAAERVVIYEDLNCPFCRELHGLSEPDEAAWAQGSDVAVEHVVVDYLSPRTTHTFSERAANLLAVVADADPEAWPAVLSALYGVRPESGTADGPTDAELVELAREAGAELDDAAAAAVADLAFADWVARTTAYAAEEGVSYIPQVYVDGELLEGEVPDVHEQMKARVSG